MNRKSFLIAAFGNLSQYYDHHLFGFLAASISRSFTPSDDPVIALLNTYFIMAIAVCAKPVGALVIGRIGDIYGRPATLKMCLLGTSAASLLISITPGYHYMGIISALILLIARMMIVAMVSSGTDGVRLYVYEHIGKSRQCLGNGLVNCSALAGSLVASTSAWFFTLDFMPGYGWRFAFVLGTVLGLGMLYIVIKNKNVDIPHHKEDPNYDEYLKKSTFRIIKENLWLFIICSFLAGSIGSINHFCVIFFGTYIFKLLEFETQSTMQLYTSIGIIIYMCSAILSGYFADNIGRRLAATLGFFALMICAIAMTLSIKSGQITIELYGLMMAAIPLLTIPSLAFLKQSIPTIIRFRIFSLAHAIGSLCISSPTPFFSTLIFETTKVSWAPMLYFIGILTVTITCIYILCLKYNANKY